MNQVRWIAAAALAVSTQACVAEGTDAEGEDGAAADEAMLLDGVQLSESEVAQYLRQAGFDEADIPLMVCTAKHESSFFTKAKNVNNNGTSDYGLFQINDRYWLDGCHVTRQELMDPMINAECAHVVFEQQGPTAWYGYKAHRAECDHYSVSSAAGGGTLPSGTCYSPSLGRSMNELSCVQSASSGKWFQCVSGEWQQGVSSGSGPAGTCSGVYPN